MFFADGFIFVDNCVHISPGSTEDNFMPLVIGGAIEDVGGGWLQFIHNIFEFLLGGLGVGNMLDGEVVPIDIVDFG